MSGNGNSAGKLAPQASLGELRIIPSKTQLFMFSASTWNRHKIHFDKDQAEAEGFPDVAVQRGLLGNFLARFVSGWAGGDGCLLRLQWKVLKSAFPGQELRCQGEVSAVSENAGAQVADCVLRIVNAAGEQVASGEARVRLPLQ